MNASVISWISQQKGVDSMLMDEGDFMDNFDEDFSAVMGKDINNCFSPLTSSVPSSSSTAIDVTGLEPFNYPTFSTMYNSMGTVLDFGNLNPSANVHQVNPIEEAAVPQVFPSIHNANSTEKAPPPKKKRIRPPSQTHDHIMAERRRREQLSQLFVALSALIPGLKKMDKGSILEDAVRYMKQLQDRVKLLEEKAATKGMKAAVVVRKSMIVVDDEEGGWDEESSSTAEEALPEIEARVWENQILIKVLCEKKNDALAKLIRKVESLNMIIVTTNATPFGDVALEITIVAEMEKEFKLTVKEVLTALGAALRPAA